MINILWSYRMMMRFILPALLAFALVAPAHAQQTAPAPQTTSAPQVAPVIGVPGTLANVVLAAVKQGAIDMTSDSAIDDFAKVEYCDIYKKYHDNEFDWRRVRVAMRKKIELDKPTYPDTLYLERKEMIGRYDFTAGMLLLAPGSVLHTRALQLMQLKSRDICSDSTKSDPLRVFPDQFLALLDKPVALDGIELTEDEARAVTNGLEVDHSTGDKTVYGRYTITLTGAEPSRPAGPAELNGKLVDVTLYQDSAYTRPFWSGLSSAKSYQQKSGAGALDVIPFKGIDPTTSQKADPTKPLPTVPAITAPTAPTPAPAPAPTAK